MTTIKLNKFNFKKLKAGVLKYKKVIYDLGVFSYQIYHAINFVNFGFPIVESTGLLFVYSIQFNSIFYFKSHLSIIYNTTLH